MDLFIETIVLFRFARSLSDFFRKGDCACKMEMVCCLELGRAQRETGVVGWIGVECSLSGSLLDSLPDSLLETSAGDSFLASKFEFDNSGLEDNEWFSDVDIDINIPLEEEDPESGVLSPEDTVSFDFILVGKILSGEVALLVKAGLFGGSAGCALLIEFGVGEVFEAVLGGSIS